MSELGITFASKYAHEVYGGIRRWIFETKCGHLNLTLGDYEPFRIADSR